MQVAERIIDHIKIVNKELNVICDFDEELIREQARWLSLVSAENYHYIFLNFIVNKLLINFSNFATERSFVIYETGACKL